jgi:integrase/recombinase XerD
MGVLREAMQREMALRGLAPRTQKTYLSWMVRLVQHSRVSPDLISEKQVRDYLAGLAQRGLSASSVNQAISAIAFFFRRVIPH